MFLCNSYFDDNKMTLKIYNEIVNVLKRVLIGNLYIAALQYD